MIHVRKTLILLLFYSGIKLHTCKIHLFSYTSTEIVFQARFRELKLRISGKCRKLIKVARKRGGTSLKSHSKGLKSRSNGLKCKQGSLRSIQIRTQLPVVCLTNRKLYILFPLNGLENTTLSVEQLEKVQCSTRV